MKFMKPLLMGVAALVVASGLAISAEAKQISGNINFAGSVTFDTTNLGTATMVNNWNMAIVSDAPTGSFSGIATGTHVTFATPYVFNPPTSYASLWTVGGFTFSLTSSKIKFQDNTLLTVFGKGFVNGPGFTQTPGTWSFSVTKSDGRTATNFSFQGNSSAVPTTPDSGSTVTLLGVAFMSIAAVRAKFRS